MSAMSNFPGGFSGGITIRNMPLAVAHPGQVFWVSSVTGSNGNRGTYDRPFGTIHYAVTQCTAAKGDIIMVMPGHIETVTAAAGLAIGTSGVAIIGLGAGGNRPMVQLTTATSATVTITAANVSVVNILFYCSVDAVVSAIVVSAADVTIKNCEMRDNGASAQMVLGILTTASADRLLVEDYFHNGSATAGADSAIAIVGGTNFVCRNFRIVGNFANAAIDFKTTAHTDCSVHDGYIWTKNSADLCIKDTVTASTGRVGPNLYLMLTDNAANITEAITAATFHYFDNIYVCNLAGEKAMLINTTASTDA